MVKISQALLYLTVFFIIVFFIEYVYFKDVYLVVKNAENSFNFKNFSIYNVFLKLFGYTIKFVCLFAFFKFILFAFDIKANVSIFKTLIITETVYLICIKGSLIIYYFFVNDDIDLPFLASFETSASLKLFFSDSIVNSVFSQLLSFITFFDLIYIFFLIFLLNIDLKIGFFKVFKTIGISYIVLLFFISAIKTLIAL